MFKKLLLLVVLIAVFVPSVAAQDQGACNIEAPASPVTVNMIGWTFPITEFYASELRACGQVQNITVNTQLLDSPSARDQVRLALSGDTASPFAIVHADDGFLLELASQGKLLALDDLIAQYSEEYDLGDIPQSLYDSASYGGAIYGLPIIANTQHFFYRTDLFEQYGIAVPTNYDEVIAACEVLQAEESLDLPFTINLHAGWAWRGEFHNFLKAFGGQWLNADSTPAFNGPEGVQAVELIQRVIDACMGELGLTYSIDDSERGLENGALAMANIWASRAANMDNPDLSQFVGQIGFAPAPFASAELGIHSGPAATDFYVIPATSTVDADLIFRIIMEAADLESQLRAAKLAVVTRGAVAAAGAGGRYLPAASQTIAGGAGGYGDDPAVAIARVAIENNLPRVITEGLSAQEALDAAAADYIREATAQGFLN